MSNDDNNGGNVQWVIGAVLVPILAACIAAGALQLKDGCLPFLCGAGHTDNDGGLPSGQSADIFLNTTSGPGGTMVNVSGEGFQPGEQILIRFHTDEVGRTQANDAGRFANVAVTVPRSYSRFAPQQFNISATGGSSLRSALAPFTISG